MSKTITLEPFVYTSVASHFVNGYQSVVIGKELNTHTETIETIYELSQAVCQQGYRDKTVSMGIVVGNHFCFLEIRPLEKDWMGRPGAYVTGQACKLAELFKTSTRSAFAIPWEKLQFISHEEALRTIKKDQNRFEQTIFRPGEEISVQDALLHQDDHDWMGKNIAPLVSTLEAVTQKKTVQIETEVATDSVSFGRCLMALIPSKRRLLSFAVSVTENDLSILQKFSLRPHLLFNSQGLGRLPQSRTIRSDSSPDTHAMQSTLEWFQEYLFKYDLDYEAEIDAIDRVFQIHQKSTKDYWKTIIEERKLREAEKFEYAITLPPNECVRRWAELLQRYKKDTDSILSDDAVCQMAKEYTEWLSRILVNLDESGTKDLKQTIDKCLQDSFLKKWRANEDQLTSIRNIFDQLGQDDGPYHAYWPICQAILEDKNQNPSDSELAVICDAHADGDVWTALLSRTVDGDGKSDRFVSQLVSLPSFQRTSAAWSRYLTKPIKAKIVNTALQSQDANIRQWCYNDENLKRFIIPKIVDIKNIAITGENVKSFFAAVEPSASECFEWWRHWPKNDLDGKSIVTKELCKKSDNLNEEQCFTFLMSEPSKNTPDCSSQFLSSIFSNKQNFSVNAAKDESLAQKTDQLYRKYSDPRHLLQTVLQSLEDNNGAKRLFLRTCLMSELKSIRGWSYDQAETKKAADTLSYSSIKARNEEFRLFAEKCLSHRKAFELWQKFPINYSYERQILWTMLPDSEDIARMGREQQKEIFREAYKCWDLHDDSSLLISALQGMLLSEFLTVQDLKDIVSAFSQVVSKSPDKTDIFKKLEKKPNKSRYHSLLLIISLSCENQEVENWGWKQLPKIDEQIYLWKQLASNNLAATKKLWVRIIKSFGGQFRQPKRIRDLLQFIANEKNIHLASSSNYDVLELVGKLAHNTRLGKKKHREWNELIRLLSNLSLRTNDPIKSFLLRFLSNLNSVYKPNFAIHCAKSKKVAIRKWGKSTKEYKNYRRDRTWTYLCYLSSIILIVLAVYASALFKWPAFIWGSSETDHTQKSQQEDQHDRLEHFEENGVNQKTRKTNDRKKYNHKR